MSDKSPEERVKAMLEAFFNARQIEVSPQGLRLWIAGLAGMTVEQIQRGIIEFTRNSTAFPSPAAIREAAGATDDDAAESAWLSVVDAIRKHGAQRVQFDDGFIAPAIMGCGGWYNLCGMTADDRVWRKRDFVAAYVTAMRSGTSDTRPLLGLPEYNGDPVIQIRTNAATGQPRLEYTPPPCRPGRLEVQEVADGMKVV